MRNEIKGAIFDLDGVITETASLHAKAWKQMFDDYNKRRMNEGKKAYQAFSIKDDYPIYIDGIPRYDGVKAFLKSRDIDLSFGNPTDEPNTETICGLGNMKNKIFRKVIKDGGVPVFEDNVRSVRNWRQRGLKTAIISSSKNCKDLLEIAGLTDLFDVRVDGVISAERNLAGKPAPDIFLEAAKELNLNPKECIVIEDALAGVEAGSKGGFNFVIGINNNNLKEEMILKGADIVVNSLQDFSLNSKKDSGSLKNAMDHMDHFAQIIKDKKTLLCLDYDGTLTPIVEDYTKADLSHEMRQKLREAAKVVPIAIVSGRDIKFIKKQVDLDELFYAGSHGFEIEGPDNFNYEVKESQKLIPALDKAEDSLRKELLEIDGVDIERKKYALAIHYRRVSEPDLKIVNQIVNDLVGRIQLIRRTEGKKVIELKPAIDWDKGKAVKVLENQILSKESSRLVIYLGDDVTDEDAFRVLTDGYGILVGNSDHDTYAGYYLKNVDEVKVFLTHLAAAKHEN